MQVTKANGSTVVCGLTQGIRTTWVKFFYGLESASLEYLALRVSRDLHGSLQSSFTFSWQKSVEFPYLTNVPWRSGEITRNIKDIETRLLLFCLDSVKGHSALERVWIKISLIRPPTWLNAPQSHAVSMNHWVGSVLGDWTPIVLLHNVLRGLKEPSWFHGNDMSWIRL